MQKLETRTLKTWWSKQISYDLKKCSKTTWPGVAKLKRLRLLAQGTRRRGARESWGGKVRRRGRVRLRSWSMPRSFPPWVGCTSTCPLLRATRERRTWAVRSFFGRSASRVRGFRGYGRIWNFKDTFFRDEFRHCRMIFGKFLPVVTGKRVKKKIEPEIPNESQNWENTERQQTQFHEEHIQLRQGELENG